MTMSTSYHRSSKPAWLAHGLGSPTGAGVRVGVIDSGWRRTMADTRVQPGISFVDSTDDLAVRRSQDTDDRTGHGTACAQLILRMAPDAEVVPIRVFGHGSETSVPTIVAALDWAVAYGLRLINISLGTVEEDAALPLYRACARARQAGVVVVAATRRSAQPSFPAAFDNAIAVARMQTGDPFCFRYCPDHHVECLAKGDHSQLEWNGRRVVRSGNSFAAPIITGILALFLQYDPELELEGMRRLLARFSTR